ncbi:response regulator [Yoonia vestfoldensis]|jgi:CheY-like chemotaxis protein|uniref:Chemotaxis protein CheY n=1 Tax=Yoonia vestfoldensis TaxID=245188 RepID=A0A1Y0E8H8_9RHOB|nr:response regulator [Yoonia vestfoldensis]ART99670.1 chemotaxis protein CheY [Yoonia vestfoldensis]
MHVLIIHGNGGLAAIWQRHLEMLGAQVTQAPTSAAALGALETIGFDVIVLDVMLDGGSALAVADMAQFRQPWASVVFVTDTTVFSDGSIFGYSGNARAFIQTATPPTDLAAIVYHYGGLSSGRAALKDR